MKRRLAIACMVFAIIGAMAEADTTSWYGFWDRAGNTWHEKWTNALDRANELPVNVRIELLGQAVRIGEKGPNIDQRVEIVSRAQSMLLSIPGYERLLTDPVKREWERVNAAATPLERHGLVYHSLYSTLGAFSAMAYLPTPATVRAMGDFLYDDRGRFLPDPEKPMNGEQLMGAQEAHPVVCDYAMSTLQALPIVDKPISGDRHATPEDLPAWRQWYREIAEGRRTFRFEGDPTEYDLDGPASAEKLARIKALVQRQTDREQRRERNKAAMPTAPAPSSSANGTAGALPERHPPHAAVLTAAGVLCATLAWFLLRRGKARPPGS